MPPNAIDAVEPENEAANDPGAKTPEEIGEEPLPPVDCVEHREALLDEALEESFPASDPPSIPRNPC